MALVKSRIFFLPFNLERFCQNVQRNGRKSKKQRLLIRRLFNHNDAHQAQSLSAPDKDPERMPLGFFELTHFLVSGARVR